MKEIEKIAKTLDKEVALLKLRTWAAFALNVICIGVMVYVLLTERVYVIREQGGIFEATPENRSDKQSLYIEADDHVRKLYATLLSFDHVDWENEIKPAYNLGGNILKDFVSALKKKGFFEEVVIENFRVKSNVLKTQLVDFSSSSVTLNVTGEMILENEYVKETRAMNMVITMVIVNRVPVLNPHGLSIEALQLPENATVTKTREEY